MENLSKVLLIVVLVVGGFSVINFHQYAEEIKAQDNYVKYLENELDNMNEDYILDVVSGSDEYQEYYKHNK